MITQRRAFFTIWFAIAAGMAWGFEFEGQIVFEPSLDIQLAHPTKFWFWIGIGTGFFVLPAILEWVHRGKEYERFYSEFRSQLMGENRSDFFRYLGRAYEYWKNNQTQYSSLPARVETLIEETDYPDWLPVLKGELLAEINRKFQTNQPPLWTFSRDLYGELDEYFKKRTVPTMLYPLEAQKFHDARQRLNYFWQDTGIRIFRDKKLRYRSIKRPLESDQRFIKALVFLSLALHRVNEQRGLGSIQFYYLAAILFEKRQRGIREWVNDPLKDFK